MNRCNARSYGLIEFVFQKIKNKNIDLIVDPIKEFPLYPKPPKKNKKHNSRLYISISLVIFLIKKLKKLKKMECIVACLNPCCA
jgi:hypothetical protein